jgi:hypothetical protein
MADINPKPFTHTAFALKREGRRPRQGRWVEIGSARRATDGGIAVYLDRLPIGFSGYVFLSPLGVTPPSPEPELQRPGAAPGEGYDEGESAED